MQEGTVMEIAKWFLGLMLLIVIISVAIFGIQLGQKEDFKQHVNFTIERNGGLTAQAVTEIQTYSKKHYGSRFTVTSNKLNRKVPFGEVVEYKVNGTFKFPLFPMIPDLTMQVSEGQGTSLIR